MNPKKILMVDSKGILNKHREELQNDSKKWEICLKTNVDDKSGGIKDAMKNTDLCVAMSSSVPGTIKKEWVSSMQNDSIVFACANPLPEIWPWDALEAGARIVATGRSDFPNQINNSLVFPGVFRGVLDVRSTKITDENANNDSIRINL
mgnify:CR=1 FL=1